MRTLTLSDLKGMNPKTLRKHIADDWQVDSKELERIKILVAYESVGAWGCDSSGFFVFRRGRSLFEVHGSHCSCYGFEGQWRPEKTSLLYLCSKHFTFSTGGYDSEGQGCVEAAKAFFKKYARKRRRKAPTLQGGTR